MVSPCKKKKLEKKGRIPLEPSPPRNTLGSRRSKNSKPLSDKKFYLDIKNHSSLKKIEAKLTSLGASLEVFLVKDVDCVVTDRDDYPRQRQGVVTPSPFCSVSPATTDSPTDGLISKRTRSRAEAMLERVRQQPQKATTDILDNAIAWRIPIYSLPKFLSWLEKVVSKKKCSEEGTRELRGHYLKLETGGGRPDFRQFRVWPRLSFSSSSEPGGFPHPPFSKYDNQRMTRKVGKTAKDGSSAPGGGNGYCEMCRVHYDQLDSHINSSQHTKIVSDPTQYTQLDTLISNHGLGSVTTLRKSLRIAKSPPVEMGGKQSSETSVLNGHVTRSKSSSQVLCNGLSSLEKKKGSPPKTVGGSGGGCSNLRIETNSAKETKEDHRELRSPVRNDHRDRDIRSPSKGVDHCQRELRPSRLEPHDRRELRSPPRQRELRSPPVVKTERELRSPIRNDNRDRELRSPHKNEPRDREIRSPSKNEHRDRELRSPPEVEPCSTDHNLRSRKPSVSTPPQQQVRLQPSPQPQQSSVSKRNRLSRKRLSVEEKLIEDNKSYYKVEVLNSKLRSTEYFITQKNLETRVNGEPLLNGDQEKCLHKDEKEPVVVRFKKMRKSELTVLSDEAENFMFGETTRKESDTTTVNEPKKEDEEDKKKKRRTQTEAFLQDNSEYYKFEVSSSRLRYQGTTLVHVPAEVDQSKKAEEKVEVEEDTAPSLKSLTFSFEKSPLKDPWMDACKRKEEGKEFYCRQFLAYPQTILPYEYPVSERLRLMSSVRGKRKDRRAQLSDEGKPRKSPRCHASTLAIMSSLMRRRPRECSMLDFTYEEESRSSLPETVESSSSEMPLIISRPAEPPPLLPVDPSGDKWARALVRLASGETQVLEVGEGPCLDVDPALMDDHERPFSFAPGLGMSLDALLQSSSCCTAMERPDHDLVRLMDHLYDSASSECSDLIGFGDDLRGVCGKRRKRKRNLTGWPVEKPRRKTIKKEDEPPPLTLPSPLIKCEPCEIKLEPVCPELLEQYSIKTPLKVESLGGGTVLRKRGRPPKYPRPSATPPPSSQTSPRSSPLKKRHPRFSIADRRSCAM